MRTKEIDVWLIENWQHKSYPGFCLSKDLSADCTIPAKLIIEFPERKVEITEKEFEDAAGEFNICKGHLFDDVLERWKEKLFKEKL